MPPSTTPPVQTWGAPASHGAWPDPAPPPARPPAPVENRLPRILSIVLLVAAVFAVIIKIMVAMLFVGRHMQAPPPAARAHVVAAAMTTSDAQLFEHAAKG